MRRLLILLTALGLFSAMAGCTHTAGICDCGDGGGHVFGTPFAGVDSHHEVVTVSPARLMPPVTSVTTMTPGTSPSVGVASGIASR
jgi:hypothetical protein